MKESNLREVVKQPIGSAFFLIVSYSNVEAYIKCKELAESLFSRIMMESVELPTYSIDSMENIKTGVGTHTRILVFKQKINREELPEVKKESIRLRERLLKKDTSIRLIPGYLNSHNVVLSSLYDDYHRIYLFHGIYAEVIYKYESLKLHYLDTAPIFFREREVIYFFSIMREGYLQNIKR